MTLGFDVTRMGVAFVRLRLLSSAGNILSPADFLRAVRRERARADRAETSFAVVTIDLAGLPVDRAARVPGLVRDLVRETDDAGWLDADRLGLLLPDTDGEQADVVAAKLRSALGDAECGHAVRACLYGDWCRSPELCVAGIRAGDGYRAHAGCLACRDGDDQSEGHRRRADDAPAVSLHDLLKIPLPAWKRAMDVVGAASLLVALWPLLVAVAVAVAQSSPGPILFRQKRAGPGGRPFDFLKFRTMYVDAEARKAELLDRNEASGPVFKMADDPRITPVGRVLRRYSLDELPQLVNVLLGDMTLVGPRPPTLDEVPQYRRWQGRRLDVTGGLTCIWQVSGRCTIPFEEWMRMDARYIQRRSPRMDLAILARTLSAVISGKGAV